MTEILYFELFNSILYFTLDPISPQVGSSILIFIQPQYQSRNLTDNVVQAYVDHDEIVARNDYHGWLSLPLRILVMTKPDSYSKMETLHFELF